jgi:hypothetical protein
MDYRTEALFKRFSGALSIFNESAIQNIVSLKSRDDCVSYSQYSDFVDHYLRAELHLDVQDLKGTFHEQAWLVSDMNKNRVMMVEHETGLEILYIASAAASIIGIIPVICAGWKFFRGRFSHRPRFHDEDGHLEIRKVDRDNVLVEQHIQNFETYVLSSAWEDNAAMKNRIEQLEQKVDELSRRLAVKKKTKKKSLPTQRRGKR